MTNVVTIKEYMELARWADEMRTLLIEADKRIIWDEHGLGRDFTDKVEAAIDNPGPPPTPRQVYDATR